MATANSPGRIWMLAAVVALGAGLWMMTGLFRGSDDTGGTEGTETAAPDRSIPVWHGAQASEVQPADAGAPSVSVARRPPVEPQDYWLMRQHAEATLEREGQLARRELAKRQAARLDILAERAERDGNLERARLLRARVTYLETVAEEADELSDQ